MSTDAKSDAVQPPKHLHKYLDCYGLDAIYNLELKITPPNEFNDPFEFTPRLSNAESERIIIHRRTTKIAEKLGVNASQAQRAEIERQMRLGGPSEFRDAASSLSDFGA